MHKKTAHVKERHGRLEANLMFQTRVGDMIRRVAGVLDDAESQVNGEDAKTLTPPKAGAGGVPQQFQSDEDGGGVMGTSKEAQRQKERNAGIGDDVVEHDIAEGANAAKAAKLANEPKYVPSFWRLVQAGHCSHVANYLSTGFPHIDGKEPKQGNTVLMASIKRGDADMVETLLRFNASTSVTVSGASAVAEPRCVNWRKACSERAAREPYAPKSVSKGAIRERAPERAATHMRAQRGRVCSNTPFASEERQNAPFASEERQKAPFASEWCGSISSQRALSHSWAF